MPSEADTCRKFVVPKLQAAGWDNDPHSIAEQRTVTDGRIVPVGKGFIRKPPKRVGKRVFEWRASLLKGRQLALWIIGDVQVAQGHLPEALNGAAWPHESGKGFTLKLSALPIGNRIVLIEPKPEDAEQGD
jgi:hypothetical protein